MLVWMSSNLSVKENTGFKDFQIYHANAQHVACRQIKGSQCGWRVEGELFTQMILLLVHSGRGGMLLTICFALAQDLHSLLHTFGRKCFMVEIIKDKLRAASIKVISIFKHVCLFILQTLSSIANLNFKVQCTIKCMFHICWSSYCLSCPASLWKSHINECLVHDKVLHDTSIWT